MEYNFFYDHLTLVPIITFILAVLIKMAILKMVTWRIDVFKSLWSWWMPSVHSALMVSIATSIWIKHSIFSDLFAITLAFSVIVLYDAINIRFQAWLHASEINKISWKELNESLWHHPSEVFMWSLLGIVVAIWLYFL